MKWSWKQWLAAVNDSDLSDKKKQLAQEFRAAFGKRRGVSVMPWELASAPTYSELNELCRAGFAYLLPGQGTYIPDFDPLPAKGSIRISAKARNILRAMQRGPLKLYRINIPGYITKKVDSTRWLFFGHEKPWRKKVDENAADELVQHRLIEPDGCGHGWPTQYTSSYRVRTRRLIGLACRECERKSTKARAK